jgi:hypothetical protein
MVQIIGAKIKLCTLQMIGAKMVCTVQINLCTPGHSTHVKLKKIGTKTRMYCANNTSVLERMRPTIKTEGEGAKSSFCVSINTVACPF